MQLHPAQGNQHHEVTAGTLQELAEHLLQEYENGGYSLLIDDVLKAYINETQYYAAWATLQAQRDATDIVLVDGNLVLMAHEYAIIEQAVRAHCELKHARLVEGSRSLGGDGFGLSVSEASQNYTLERDRIAQLAFCEPPFSFKTLGDL